MNTFKYLGLVVMAAILTLACNDDKANTGSEENENATPQEQVTSPTPGQTPAGGADEYGRMPGDEHYGHNHPPQGAQPSGTPATGSPVTAQPQTAQPQTEQPANSGPDKFGRMPGDEHYGHDHE